MAGLPVAPGDWRFQNEEALQNYGGSNGQPGEPYWLVSKSRYMDGLPCPGICLAFVNPYNGQVYGWSTKDYAQFSRPSGAILTQAQAQQIAYNTYRQLTDLAGTLVQSNLVWATLSSSTTLTRLQYGFGYETPPVTTPASDPDYPEETITQKYFLGVVVDAETGEVLSADWGGGAAGGGGDKPWKATPRVALLNALLSGNEKVEPLVLIIASGKHASATVPGESARQFAHSVKGKPIRFALNAAKCRLTWENAPGVWTGIKTTTEAAKRLNAWLNETPR